MENELYHYGVKGMKWGVRRKKNKPNNNWATTKLTKKIISKRNESVELHKNDESSTAKLLGKIIPSVKEKQKLFRDYTIKSKTGETVGNMSINMNNKDVVNCVWIGINNKSGGKGYAQSAMRSVIDEVEKSGFKKMTLEVPTNSPNARHIYEKLGFKDTGEKMLGDADDIWGGLTRMELRFDGR